MFTTDDQMAVFQFVASGSGPIIDTLSYNGGTNAVGTPIAPGGFITALTLFGPDTSLKASTPFITEDGNGLGDSTINTASPPVTIIPGDTYFVVLTQFDNLLNNPQNNFGDGFKETGNPDFTAGNGCADGPFCDPNKLANDTGNWALDIDGVASAQQQQSAVPEPATFLMLGTVLAGLLASRRLNSAARRSL